MVRGVWRARVVAEVQAVRGVLGALTVWGAVWAAGAVREVLRGWDATVARAASLAVLASAVVQAVLVRLVALAVTGVQASAGVQRGRAAEAREVGVVVLGVQVGRAAALPGAAGAGRSADSPLGVKVVRSLNGCVRGV